MMPDSQTKKRSKPEPIPTAAPRTEFTKVPHPTLAGHIEIAQRVIDTLLAMVKRRHITERQYQAAEKYRTAHATLYGVMGGSMDFDRARGGSSPGQPPALTYMVASQLVSDTKKFLYPKDYAVVHRIAALGFSIKETTEALYGKPSTRGQEEDCGRRLREGLNQMADRWFPENEGRGSSMRSHVSERAGVTDVESVPQARAVHATRDRVFGGGK